MKNRFQVFLISVLFSLIILSSYKIFESTRFQTTLLYDFNNDKYTFPIETLSILDDNYPNLSLTSVPIKVLKARYFINIDSVAYAKELLFDAIKVNPYLKSSEVILSEIYYNEKKFDSSLYYAKDAFYQLPNSNIHRNQYFKNLKFLKDTVELDYAFSLIKEFNKLDHWYEYIIVRDEIAGKSDSKLVSTIKEFKEKFPNEDHTKINDLEKVIMVGSEQYAKSFLIAKEAAMQFENKNFSKAFELYESAILLNNTEYTFYENSGIAYALVKDYDNAVKKYDEVIYRFKTKNGKSEYLKGILKLQLNQKEAGCKYLKLSAEKKYIDKGSNVNPAIIYQNFCLN